MHKDTPYALIHLQYMSSIWYINAIKNSVIYFKK